MTCLQFYEENRERAPLHRVASIITANIATGMISISLLLYEALRIKKDFLVKDPFYYELAICEFLFHENAELLSTFI